MNLLDRRDAARLLAVTFTAFAAFAISLFTDAQRSDAQKSETGEIVLAGTITGRVFQDFNGNGLFETTGGTSAAPTSVDAGVAGVTVSAYDAAGALAGSTTSAATTGLYSLSAGGTGPYRIEFTTLPAGYSPSARNTDSVSGATAADSGSTVQFVADGVTANVNLALNRGQDYCEDNPLICSQMYEPVGGDAPTAIFTIPYRAGSTATVTGGIVTGFQNPAPTGIASMLEVGTTFGLAQSRSTNRVFSAAFMKKHAALGPGGTGAIYVVNRGTGAVSQYTNLNTIFGATTAGANPHNTADYDIDNGQLTWDAVGKVAFGGLAISPDETLLYAMNLANRTLYEIPATVTPTAGNIRTSAFPATMPGCTNADDVRPFAVTFYEGLIYVGAVCSGDTSDLRSDVDAYVYTVNPTTLAFSAAPVFQTPLDYPRLGTDNAISANWLAWRNVFSSISAGLFIYPQPMLTDIDFDRGNLILSLRDRDGEQTGRNNRSNPGNTTQLQKGITAGEILRACGSPALGWTIESNGVCGGVGTAGAGTAEGPGGGEYYFQDNYHPNGTPHDEVGVGAAHQIPGHNEMVATVFDPVYNSDAQNVFDSGGFRWLMNVTATAGNAGTQNRSHLSYFNGDFAKANGMGNVIALCTSAPIEIGNRIWRDTNGNGVQDPGETPLAGVTVRLYQGSTLVGTAVTDANGEYYFVSSTVADPNTGDNLGQVNGGVLPGTTYQVRLDNLSNFLSGGPLAGLRLTGEDETGQLGDDDSSDSDATFVTNPAGSPTGTFPVISVTTGVAGANNHTFDIGFVTAPTAAPVSVEGRVLTASGSGIRNARVVLNEANGTTHSVLTGTFGYYRFDSIPAGQTAFVTVTAKRFTFSAPTRVVNLEDNLSGIDFHAD